MRDRNGLEICDSKKLEQNKSMSHEQRTDYSERRKDDYGEGLFSMLFFGGPLGSEFDDICDTASIT
jgi:hypothetical protein